jgi:hypothetical protein
LFNLLDKLIFRKLLFIAPVLIIVATLISAIDCSKSSTKEPDFMLPDSNLSFKNHIHPIFLEQCADLNGCHASIDPAAGLDLETLSPTFQSNDRPQPTVVPYLPENSLLYRVLLGDVQDSYGYVSEMPKDQAPLSQEMIDAIGTWIDEGARINN